MITDRVKPPPRESGLTVRLSEDERKPLEAYAVRHDLRLGQVLRRLVRDLPNALESTRDGTTRPTRRNDNRNGDDAD